MEHQMFTFEIEAHGFNDIKYRVKAKDALGALAEANKAAHRAGIELRSYPQIFIRMDDSND